MKRETVAVVLAGAGVVVSLLAWLMPFRAVGLSPASILVRTDERATENTSLRNDSTQGHDISAVSPASAQTLSAPPATDTTLVTAIDVTPQKPDPASTTTVTSTTSESTHETMTSSPSSRERRSRWLHTQGSFVLINGTSWSELRSDGALAFTFREYSRDADEIILHDASRDCYVRLTATACDVKCMWWPQYGYKLEWNRYYSGAWQY